MFVQTAEKQPKRTLGDIVAMTPIQMAQESLYIQNAYAYVSDKVKQISSPLLKEQLSDMFFNCAVTFAKHYESFDSRKSLRKQMMKKGYLYSDVSLEQFMPSFEAIPPVWAAAGSGYRGHHAHPGGLVVHIEENLRLSLYLAKLYKEMYGLDFDEDMLIFSQTVHDLSKGWLANWQEDGSTHPQYCIAETGAHHIFALAESIYRNIPPEYLYCQAAVHLRSTSKSSYYSICEFLKAAFLVAQKEPQRYGLWDSNEQLAFDHRREEFWFVNMGDQMLFTVCELRYCTKILREIAIEKFSFSESDINGKPFNQLRNYLFSQCSIAVLFAVFRKQGADGLQVLLEELIEF